MLRRRAVLGTPKCEKSVGRRGSAPHPAGGAYSAPPGPLARDVAAVCRVASVSPSTHGGRVASPSLLQYLGTRPPSRNIRGKPLIIIL